MSAPRRVASANKVCDLLPSYPASPRPTSQNNSFFFFGPGLFSAGVPNQQPAFRGDCGSVCILIHLPPLQLCRKFDGEKQLCSVTVVVPQISSHRSVREQGRRWAGDDTGTFHHSFSLPSFLPSTPSPHNHPIIQVRLGRLGNWHGMGVLILGMHCKLVRRVASGPQRTTCRPFLQCSRVFCPYEFFPGRVIYPAVWDFRCSGDSNMPKQSASYSKRYP